MISRKSQVMTMAPRTVLMMKAHVLDDRIQRMTLTMSEGAATISEGTLARDSKAEKDVDRT